MDHKRKFFLWVAANWETLSTVGKLFFAVGGGTVTGWAAWATSALEVYAPWSYVFAFVVGTAFSSLTLACWSWFMAERIRASYLRTASGSSMEFNPLSDPTVGKRIYLSDLIHPVGEPTENKTFVSCEFVGPGVIFFASAQLHNFHVGNCEMIKMSGDHVRNLPNKAIFKDCTFRDCKFYNLVIMVPDSFHAKFDRIFGQPVEWL